MCPIPPLGRTVRNCHLVDKETYLVRKSRVGRLGARVAGGKGGLCLGKFLAQNLFPLHLTSPQHLDPEQEHIS